MTLLRRCKSLSMMRLRGCCRVTTSSCFLKLYSTEPNTAADVVEKITDLQKKVKDLEKEETKVQQTNTQNNIFMGSTSELMKMLKKGTER